MKMINRRKSIALAVLSVCLAGPAMAQTANMNARPRPAQNVIVIEHADKAVWPLYSPLCEYKTVMNNQDMHRCGLFLNISPYPVVEVARVDPRTLRNYR